MKLIEAQTRIEKLAYIPFKEYLSPDQVQDAMMKINKGKTGQLLELTIGLNLSNTTLDFEDGELKTNIECKCRARESICCILKTITARVRIRRSYRSWWRPTLKRSPATAPIPIAPARGRRSARRAAHRMPMSGSFRAAPRATPSSSRPCCSGGRA